LGDLDPRIAGVELDRSRPDAIELGRGPDRETEVLAAGAAHRLGARLEKDELLVAVAAQHHELAIAGQGRHLGPAEDVAVEAQQRGAAGLVERTGRDRQRHVVEALCRLLGTIAGDRLRAHGELLCAFGSSFLDARSGGMGKAGAPETCYPARRARRSPSGSRTPGT